MKLFLLALQFLTRIPVKVSGPVSGEDLARSMAFYPLVGLIVGGGAALVNFLFSFLFAPPVGDIFSLIFLIIITGNMHLDGLMDAADGFFSGKPRERILEIMKDSRVGSHGVVAGSITLLLKFVLLSQLLPEDKVPALVVIPVLSRWSQVYGAKVYPYARTGKGTGFFTDYVGWKEFLPATIIALVTVIAVFCYAGLFLVAVTFAGTAILGGYVCRKIGGVTGDTLGAITECIEVLVLLVLASNIMKSFL